MPLAEKISGASVGFLVGAGVAVTFGIGVAVGSGVAVGVGIGVAVGSGVTVGSGSGVAVGSGVTVGVGTGVAVGAGVIASVGPVVTVGSGEAVAVVEGLVAGCEQPTVTILIMQIKSVGRIRRCKMYLYFFIKGISVSLVLVILLYTMLKGNTTG